jgi:hypothetical protein
LRWAVGRVTARSSSETCTGMRGTRAVKAALTVHSSLRRLTMQRHLLPADAHARNTCKTATSRLHGRHLIDVSMAISPPARPVNGINRVRYQGSHSLSSVFRYELWETRSCVGTATLAVRQWAAIARYSPTPRNEAKRGRACRKLARTHGLHHRPRAPPQPHHLCVDDGARRASTPRGADTADLLSRSFDQPRTSQLQLGSASHPQTPPHYVV